MSFTSMSLRALLSSLICAFFCASALADKVVLGKLGQATEGTSIRSSASSRGRVFYKVKQYEYLVVRDSSRNGWKRVLMQNGTYGYVDASDVAVLPYEVTADAAKGSAPRSGKSMLASRASGTGAALAQHSLNFVGTPYQWGGNDMANGIDCSGFIKQLYGQVGLNLPRTAAEQVNVGKAVTRLENLQPGDRLYFWDKKRGKVGHTGIYYGNGYFVHSSSGNKSVQMDFLDVPKWRNILVAARR